MPLAQLRDAARTNFTSVEEMQAWLKKPAVLGDRRKLLDSAEVALKRGLKLCPLSSRAYLMLSEMAWLHGSTAEEEHELLVQAYDVRPYDARVHYVLGREILSDQSLSEQERLTQAVDHWREAFDRDPAYRRQLINGLSTLLPASFFLDNFETDRESLAMLRKAYANSPDEKGYRRVLGELAVAEYKAAKEAIGEEAVEHWIAASGVYAELKDESRALAAANAAVKANPVSFNAHIILGNYLYDRGDYSEAAEHLTWCVHRRPDDESIRQRAAAAIMKAGSPSVQTAREQDEWITR
jgi:tetratricopeptide (TPR) repeat protein